MTTPTLVLLVLISSSLFSSSLSKNAIVVHQPSRPEAHITVMGFVYCDICSNNTFSRHSYFMPGAEVRVYFGGRDRMRRVSDRILVRGQLDEDISQVLQRPRLQVHVERDRDQVRADQFLLLQPQCLEL